MAHPWIFTHFSPLNPLRTWNLSEWVLMLYLSHMSVQAALSSQPAFPSISRQRNVNGCWTQETYTNTRSSHACLPAAQSSTLPSLGALQTPRHIHISFHFRDGECANRRIIKSLAAAWKLWRLQCIHKATSMLPPLSAMSYTVEPWIFHTWAFTDSFSKSDCKVSVQPSETSLSLKNTISNS